MFRPQATLTVDVDSNAASTGFSLEIAEIVSVEN
jgi:hypothetical protein